MSFTDTIAETVGRDRLYNTKLAETFAANDALMNGFADATRYAVMQKVLRQLSSGRDSADVRKVKVYYRALRDCIGRGCDDPSSELMLINSGRPSIMLPITDASGNRRIYDVDLVEGTFAHLMPPEMHEVIVSHLRSVDERVETVTFRGGYMRVTFSPTIEYSR